jgi:hypothetical protein
MIAVDTNVLVRLLRGDDSKQEEAARSLFARGPIWIAKTVLLETAWVLGSLYGLEEAEIRGAFTKLLGLQNVHTEDESSVAAALALTTPGIEWRLPHSTSPSFRGRGASGYPIFPESPLGGKRSGPLTFRDVS